MVGLIAYALANIVALIVGVAGNLVAYHHHR
jgi:hypothetical protein